MKDKIALIILAAGESKRLGRPKQLLTFEGQTLLGSVVSKMTSLELFDKYLVLGHKSDEIINSINLEHWKVIENLNWKKGLGNSIAEGIRALDEQYDYAILMLGDQYKIIKEDILHLVNKRTCDNILLATEGTQTSPPALWPKKYFKELKKLNDDSGARVVIRNHQQNVVGVKLPMAFYDVDVEEDVTRWQSYVSKN